VQRYASTEYAVIVCLSVCLPVRSQHCTKMAKCRTTQTTLCWAGFYQLRQIRQAIRSLIPDAARTIVQAFIACRLDWCNSLLYGVPENLLRKLQSVQNAAARLLTSACRCDHITLLLRRRQLLRRGLRVLMALQALMALNSMTVQILLADVDEKYERRRGASLPASLIFKN